MVFFFIVGEGGWEGEREGVDKLPRFPSVFPSVPPQPPVSGARSNLNLHQKTRYSLCSEKGRHDIHQECRPSFSRCCCVRG